MVYSKRLRKGEILKGRNKECGLGVAQCGVFPCMYKPWVVFPAPKANSLTKKHDIRCFDTIILGQRIYTERGLSLQLKGQCPFRCL